MNDVYVIGLDFGSLSGRALLVNAVTGEELCESVLEYPHAVMYTSLPDGTPLPTDSAVQHPEDYLLVLRTVVRDVIKRAAVSPSRVIGIGVDFTCATVLPVDRDLKPLCLDPRFVSHPKAYVTMWKDHTAAEQAAKIDAVASRRKEAFFDRCGNKCSAENGLAKILCILQTDPQVYAEADQILEAGDWITQLMTGNRKRSYNIASCKEFWARDLGGYPSEDFMEELDPAFRFVVSEKLGGNDAVSLSPRFGALTAEGARLTGLEPGTAVAVPFADANISMIACGVTQPGSVAMIVGTSLCHFALSERYSAVPGMFTVAVDAIYEGFTLYEAGQSSCGDHLSWYIDRCLPESYFAQAREQGKNIHAFLREKAMALRPGESGLLCLDWFNGNRSVLNDADLSGMLIGMTLQTAPEEIYRAFLEGTVFGTRRILETMFSAGLDIRRIVACGGIARKDPLMMQLFADITKIPVCVSPSMQAPARSAAILAATAAGKAAGGYDTLHDACKALSQAPDPCYTPDPRAGAVYDRLYDEYLRLHDYFGRESGVMHRLKALSEKEKQRG